MYKVINGWTKAKIKQQIYTKNNGKVSVMKTIFIDPTQDLSKNTNLAPIFVDRSVYETDSGNHCAIGCFIPDGHAGMKHPKNVSSLLKEFPDLESQMPLERCPLKVLQKVHDSYLEEGDVRDVLCNWIDDNVTD